MKKTVALAFVFLSNLLFLSGCTESAEARADKVQPCMAASRNSKSERTC